MLKQLIFKNEVNEWQEQEVFISERRNLNNRDVFAIHACLSSSFKCVMIQNE